MAGIRRKAMQLTSDYCMKEHTSLKFLKDFLNESIPIANVIVDENTYKKIDTVYMMLYKTIQRNNLPCLLVKRKDTLYLVNTEFVSQALEAP